MNENGEREIELARENQDSPEASQMYAQMSIAISLKRIADAMDVLRDPFSDGSLAVTIDAVPRTG
jgi:hypothetical protein